MRARVRVRMRVRVRVRADSRLLEECGEVGGGDGDARLVLEGLAAVRKVRHHRAHLPPGPRRDREGVRCWRARERESGKRMRAP